MKLQLDTKQKTIKIEESVNLNELFETIKRILPNGLWEEFTLEVNTIINWKDPIVIPYQPTTPNPYPYQPWISYDVNTTVLNSGCYNIEYEIK